MRAGVALLVAVLVVGCFPSDPFPPIGLELVGDGGTVEDVRVHYTLCEGERVEQVGVRRAERELLGDGSEVIWAIRASDSDADEHAGDRIAVDVGAAPDGLMVEVPLTDAVASESEVGVDVVTDLFEQGVTFRLDELEASRVFVDGDHLTQTEFLERFACEEHRR